MAWMKDVALLLLNISSTVGIVLVNKHVMIAFPYVMSLTLLHMVVGGIILSTQSCSCKPTKSMPFRANCWIGALMVFCIYLLNQSLRMNTVTLYQITKLMGIPLQCIWQYITVRQAKSAYVYGALVLLTLGVGATTVAELNLQASPVGLGVAVVAVLVVVVEQAEIGRLKNEYEMTSTDLLQTCLPHRCIIGAVMVCATEIGSWEVLQNMPLSTYGLLGLSCLFATILNITVVQILGKFGPVTCAVVGHVKTVAVLMMGFFLRPPVMDIMFGKQILGITIAMLGAIKYGQYTAFPDADCRSVLPRNKGDLPGDTMKTLSPRSGSKAAITIATVLVALVLMSILFSSGSMPNDIRFWPFTLFNEEQLIKR